MRRNAGMHHWAVRKNALLKDCLEELKVQVGMLECHREPCADKSCPKCPGERLIQRIKIELKI